MDTRGPQTPAGYINARQIVVHAIGPPSKGSPRGVYDKEEAWTRTGMSSRR